MKITITEKSKEALIEKFPILVKHNQSSRVLLMLNKDTGISIVNTTNLESWCDTPVGCLVDIKSNDNVSGKNIYGLGYSSYESFRKDFHRIQATLKLEF
jgi:hypothetical protein